MFPNFATRQYFSALKLKHILLLGTMLTVSQSWETCVHSKFFWKRVFSFFQGFSLQAMFNSSWNISWRLWLLVGHLGWCFHANIFGFFNDDLQGLWRFTTTKKMTTKINESQIKKSNVECSRWQRIPGVKRRLVSRCEADSFYSTSSLDLFSIQTVASCESSHVCNFFAIATE